MNIKLHFILLALLAFGCEDPRPTQREDNLFDPDNAFIRFNYDSRINEPARDSLLLSRLEFDTFEIPIALSAAPQEQPVEVDISLSTMGEIKEGTHFELLKEDGEPLSGGRIALPAGQFDHMLQYIGKDTLPEGQHRIRLELTGVAPDFIHLGFPGSGRGRQFDLIFE